MRLQSAFRFVRLALTLSAAFLPWHAPAQTNYYWSKSVASLVDSGSPQGVAVDVAGNIYIADANKHVILRVTPAGTNWLVSTIAGLAGVSGPNDGTNSAARFFGPGGVAVDTAGNVYIADTGNNAIRKITPSGTNWIVTTIAGVAGAPAGFGDGTNAAVRFATPQGIAVDIAGNLFVSDDAAIIRKISHSGTNWIVTTIAGADGNGGYNDGTNAAAQFFYPFGVAVDAADNVYVADAANNAIRQVIPSGTNWIVTTIGGQPGDSNSTSGSDDGLTNASRFWFPVGVAVDADGNVYVADENNSIVREIIPTGGNWNTVTIGGSAGAGGNADGTNITAAFISPSGVAVDALGNVFVVDNFNNNLRLGQIFPPPLQIRHVSKQMSIFYRFADGTNLNFTLQSTTNLNDGNWGDVTNGWKLDTNGVAFVTLTPTNKVPSVFFRLLQP